MNSQQLAAATAPNGYVEIVAGPGTGKTFTLVERILELLRRGIPANKICLMTFTNAAAREIRNRVLAKVPEAKQLVVGTFHSVAIRYLAIALKGAPIRILDEFDRMEIIKGIASKHSVKPELLRRDITAASTRGRNDPFLPFSKEAVAEYFDVLNRTNMMDFDLLLARFYIAVRKSGIPMPFDAILVDEFQDTSLLQLKICLSMGKRMGDKANVTIVGDPDQSIYGFRAAEPRNFQIFCDAVKDMGHQPHIFKLEINYRSTGPILQYASNLISGSYERFGGDRRLTPAPELELGKVKAKPKLHKYATPLKQAEGIQKHISALVTKGVKPSEIAVLCRTSMPLMEIESSLSTGAGLQTRVLGGGKFGERYEIRTILDYLRVANNPGDVRAILRTINNPKRKIGDKSLDLFFPKYCHLDALKPFAKRANVKQYLDLVNEIVMDTAPVNGSAGLQAAIKRIASRLELNPQQEAAVRVLEETAGRFAFDRDMMQYLVAEDEELTDLKAFLFNWTLSTEKDNNNDCITLSTVHSAKGLEWPVVIFADLSSNWLSAMSDEERRVIYVALTRAKALLMVTYCQINGLHPMYADLLRSVGGTKMSEEWSAQDYKVLSSTVGRSITLPSTSSKQKPLADITNTSNATKRAQYDSASLVSTKKPSPSTEDPLVEFGGFVSAASLPS